MVLHSFRLQSPVSQYLSFFFIVIPPPPSSTLFPYTTLFRSMPEQGSAEGLSLILMPVAYFGYDQVEICEDRKSTRLNSSHRCTSYAVFCLKKKNKAKSNARMLRNNKNSTVRPVMIVKQHKAS